MISLALGFQDFWSVDDFCNLQMNFLKDGIDEKGKITFIKNPLTELKINTLGTICIPNNHIPELSNIDIDFYSDFLKEEIPRIADRTFQYLKNEANKKNRFSKYEIEDFLNPTIEGLNTIEKYLEDIEYLPTEYHNLLMFEFYKLQSYIRAYINNPYPGIKSKIPLKWTRTEIEYFFYLLRENDQLGKISNADLGSIIDNVFECQTDKAGNIFKPIRNSYKHLSDFKKNGGRPQTSANEALKKIFSEDFFSF